MMRVPVKFSAGVVLVELDVKWDTREVCSHTGTGRTDCGDLFIAALHNELWIHENWALTLIIIPFHYLQMQE